MTHDVFVSYSSKDKAVADAIVASFESNDIRCWYAPRDIKPGEDWGEAITKAIDSSRVFVLIFSGHANHSQHVLDELLYSIDLERTILPFRIEKLDPIGAMKLHLSSRHWLDAFDPSWEPYIKKLIANASEILNVPLEKDDIKISDKFKAQAEKRAKNRILKIILGIILPVVLIVGGILLSRLIKTDGQSGQVTETSLISPAPSETSESEWVETVEPTEVIIDRSGEIDLAFADDIVTFNPQKSGNRSETTLVENLFLGLVSIDKETSQIIPAAAESWSISMDGRTYTFNIREDIPWVSRPLNGETELVVDEEGNPRYLSAQDFVYGIQLLCNPNSQSHFSSEAMVIKGCEEVFMYDQTEEIPEDLINSIAVRAISDHELMIELVDSSSQFLGMLSNTFFYPLPSWAIEKFGDAWMNPGNIQTNGHFVIEAVALGESITLARNPFLPEDLAGEGNIGTVHAGINISPEEQYATWLTNDMDIAPIPDEKVFEHKQQFPDEYIIDNASELAWLDLNTNIAPFDNVHVRRAFAAALDKEYLVTTYIGEAGIAIDDLVVPYLLGSPVEDINSPGYDLEFAKNELAEGGYPECNGLPEIYFSDQTGLIDFPEEVLRLWEANLGCPENTILLETEGWDPEQTNLKLNGVAIGNIYQSALYDFVLSCGDSLGWRFDRECNHIDDLREQTELTLSLAERAAITQDLEEAAFGFEGDFPIIPMFKILDYSAVHSYLQMSINDSNFWNWSIDMSEKP